MPPHGVIQRAFAAGELSPGLHARADLAKYSQGARTCKNWLVLKSGGVANRPGLRFVAACKTTSDDVKLLRYISEEQDESLLIEHGLGYFRFYQGGAPLVVTGVAAWSAVVPYVPGDLVTDAGVTYYATAASLNQTPPDVLFWHPLPAGDVLEIPAPQNTDLYDAVQSGRVITLTHPDQVPQELTCISLTQWTLAPVTTLPSIAAPTGEAGVAGAAGARTLRYQVTAAKADTYEESLPSGIVTIAATLEGTPDVPNTLAWTAVPGAVEYYVYEDPYNNGVFGFIGTATTNAFNDIGQVPDFGVTPPIGRVLFATANNYPAHAAYYQQRRFFAYTNFEPEAIWASRTGFPSNFSISSPLQDDDALTFRIMGNTHHPVRHLLGLRQLIVLTDGGGWSVGAPKDPLTPSHIPTDQEVYVGSHDKAPVVVGNAILYVQARGSVLREVRFDQAVEGLAGRDLTIYASHLFDGRSMARIDYAHAPHSIVWVVQGGNTFLGLTYIPEQEIWGWHRHDSAGASFDDVCVVPEHLEDVPYFIVRREIGGTPVVYIERLERRFLNDFDEDVFFVDSGLSYSGAPATVFSGLAHLEGEIVAVVGDGDVIFDGDPASADAATYTVTGGSITLPSAKSEVHIGLPIRFADLETLDLDLGAQGRDHLKSVKHLSVLLDKSSRSFWAGPDAAHLKQHRPKRYETAVDEYTGQVEIAITTGFSKYGRILIRQTDPLPICVLGVVPHGDIGG